VIGVSPGKYIWRMAIALHCFPRFLVASLYHQQFRSSLTQLRGQSTGKTFLLRQLIRVNTSLELCELFGLILVSYISSKENYAVHEKAFVIFMCSATLRMVTCLILFRQIFYRLWLHQSADDKHNKFRFQTSYQWKRRFFFSALIFSLLLVVAYARHTSKCSNNVGQPSTAWSYFSACEYIVCCLIMAYHATVSAPCVVRSPPIDTVSSQVCWDFNHFELTIYNTTTTDGRCSFVSERQATDDEHDDDDDGQDNAARLSCR
jgi:post-GPI attachment to proteins factor 2